VEYTTLGRTGLKVSVAGLGCGGFSRLGLLHGRTDAEAALLVRQAVDLGVNFIDTASVYGTEPAVGLALKHIQRDQVVVATKSSCVVKGQRFTPAQVVASLENSLKVLGTDYIDVFMLHAVQAAHYDYVRDTLLPVLDEQKAKGKIRYTGLTEWQTGDHQQEMMTRAAQDGLWDVAMVAFHMMHQGARKTVFPFTQKNRVGTLLMLAVRSIFAKPERVVAAMRDAAARGLVEKWLGESAEPLSFLIHDGGARDITEAAYRFARHEPGVDVVLFGTSDIGHLKQNLVSLLKPPLPTADREKLATLFGHLYDVGMDSVHGSR
jgi:aryl-alcohol dehydrogenase-like predicted oxidoreductase